MAAGEKLYPDTRRRFSPKGIISHYALSSPCILDSLSNHWISLRGPTGLLIEPHRVILARRSLGAGGDTREQRVFHLVFLLKRLKTVYRKPSPKYSSPKSHLGRRFFALNLTLKVFITSSPASHTDYFSICTSVCALMGYSFYWSICLIFRSLLTPRAITNLACLIDTCSVTIWAFSSLWRGVRLSWRLWCGIRFAFYKMICPCLIIINR